MNAWIPRNLCVWLCTVLVSGLGEVLIGERGAQNEEGPENRKKFFLSQTYDLVCQGLGNSGCLRSELALLPQG